MPPDLWPEILEHLPRPLNDKQVHFDLRWLWDQGRGVLPSRKDLARRWGWTLDEARTPLRNPKRWMDKYSKYPYPEQREGTSRRALTTRDPGRPDTTTADQDDTEEREESPSVDQRRPALTTADPPLPQRGDLPPSPPPPPPPPDSKQGARSERRTRTALPDGVVPLAHRPRLVGAFARSPEIDEVCAVCEAESNRLRLPMVETFDLQVVAQRVAARELDVALALRIAAWAAATTDRWWRGTKPGHPDDKRKWSNLLGDEKFWSEVLPGAERAARRLEAHPGPPGSAAAAASPGPPMTVEEWRRYLAGLREEWPDDLDFATQLGFRMADAPRALIAEWAATLPEPLRAEVGLPLEVEHAVLEQPRDRHP